MHFPSRHWLLSLLFVAFTAAPVAAQDAQPQMARGVVFNDMNGDGVQGPSDKGIPNVRVSNQREVVLTDEEGRYELPVTDDTIIFVVKPVGRYPLMKNGLPQFYYIHKPAGSPPSKYPGVAPTGPLPESVDFPLHQRWQTAESTLNVLVFGDTQSRDVKEVDYLAHKVVEEIAGQKTAHVYRTADEREFSYETPRAKFGVTLGDVAFDNLSVYEPQNETLSTLRMPWYNVRGNHDTNYDAKEDRYTDETFERVFGPTYYSFDYHNVHFVVLDDIEWTYDENGKGKYRGGFGEQQLEWLKNDLAFVPKDRMVVLMMHIPIYATHDREDLYRLIEDRPNCVSFSAHTHTHEHHFLTEDDGWRGEKPHHHIVHGTACGSWWGGRPDEYGIPNAMMSDGTPQGYSHLKFIGDEASLRYRVAGRPESFQMAIHAPELVAPGEQADILANVFNSSERSTVEMRIDHAREWTPMEKVAVEDPAFVAAVELDKSLPEKPWRNLPNPHVCTHMWKGSLPTDLAPGTHVIYIRATGEHDPTGRLQEPYHYGRRLIRVSE